MSQKQHSLIDRLFNDITTTKDGKSFDVIRVGMTLIILIIPPFIIWVMIMATIAAFGTFVKFDAVAIMTGFGAFLISLGTFFGGSAIGLKMKSSTEPNDDKQPCKE